MDAAVLTQRISERLLAAEARPVITDATGGEATGGELLERTARTTTLLADVGCQLGCRVGVVVHPTVQGVVDLLAVMANGGVIVPITPAAPPAYRAHLLESAGCTVVLENGVVTLLPLSDAAGESVPSGTALLAFTSGTTGAPKGILHTQATLLASCESVATAWGITDEDRLLHVLPLNHVHGLVVGLLGSLAVGASVDLLARFDERSVAEAASSATMFYGVPTMYFRMAAAGRASDLRHLRLAVCGSAPLSAELARALGSSGVPLLERYGMTETCLTVSQPLHGARVPGTVGGALPGVELRIIDGALDVRTPALSVGIFGRPGPLPDCDAEGWFATGDLVTEGEGGLRIVGRRSNLIISGGFNVVPEAVEAVIGQHPAVVEALVRGEDDPALGQIVVAEVVLRDDGTSIDEVRAFVGAQIPRSHQPRRYDVVAAVPRNAMGKIIRG